MLDRGVLERLRKWIEPSPGALVKMHVRSARPQRPQRRGVRADTRSRDAPVARGLVGAAHLAGRALRQTAQRPRPEGDAAEPARSRRRSSRSAAAQAGTAPSSGRRTCRCTSAPKQAPKDARAMRDAGAAAGAPSKKDAEATPPTCSSRARASTCGIIRARSGWTSRRSRVDGGGRRELEAREGERQGAPLRALHQQPARQGEDDAGGDALDRGTRRRPRAAARACACWIYSVISSLTQYSPRISRIQSRSLPSVPCPPAAHTIACPTTTTAATTTRARERRHPRRRRRRRESDARARSSRWRGTP